MARERKKILLFQANYNQERCQVSPVSIYWTISRLGSELTYCNNIQLSASTG